MTPNPDDYVSTESIMGTVRQQQRTKKIFRAGLSAIFCKGAVLAASAISIPIVIRYLGSIQFGIWVTISTTVALLALLDLGIASAVTNLISEAYALNDKEVAQKYASTGFWTMVLLALGLGLLGAAIWPFIDWAGVFHLAGEANESLVSHAVAAAYVIFLIGLPATLAAKLLAGYQEVNTANLFSAAGAVANLSAVVLTTVLHGSLVMLIVASSGAMAVTNVGCLIWIWVHHKPWLAPSLRACHIGTIKQMVQGSGSFFVLQLTGLVVFNSDNFVIAHYLGPAQVTPYSVTWRLVGYSAALQTIMTPALWPAYAEAYIQKDLAWIRSTLRRVMQTTMGVAGACCLIFIIAGQSIIRVWAGAAAVPSRTLIVLMCGWILICTFMTNTATVLMATSETKLQAWLSVVAAAINLIVSIWLVQRIGAEGVISGTILSYVLVLIGPQTWKVIKVLRPGLSLPISESPIRNLQ
jgi:O-antigen/teichoic acid export membrane protein